MQLVTLWRWTGYACSLRWACVLGPPRSDSCPSFLVVYGFQRPSDWLTLRVLWFPPPLASLIWPALSFSPVRSLSLLGSRPSFHHFGISVCLPPHSSWELLWCLAPSAVLHAAVTPCFFILILVTFIYYRYYTHLFIYILYIYFLFLSFFPFGPPSTHWVVPRALFIKLVKRSCPVPVTDTLCWVSFSLAVGALYKLYYYYYYMLILIKLILFKFSSLNY